jgi:hypothetical protein
MDSGYGLALIDKKNFIRDVMFVQYFLKKTWTFVLLVPKYIDGFHTNIPRLAAQTVNNESSP